MTDINIVALVGRLTRDAELNYTATGTAKCAFSIAVNRSVKNGDEWKDEASFFDCQLWGNYVARMKQYLVKGKQIAITGQLMQQRWKGDDGQNRSRVVINVYTLQLLGNKNGGSNQENLFETPQQNNSDLNLSLDNIPF